MVLQAPTLPGARPTEPGQTEQEEHGRDQPCDEPPVDAFFTEIDGEAHPNRFIDAFGSGPQLIVAAGGQCLAADVDDLFVGGFAIEAADHIAAALVANLEGDRAEEVRVRFEIVEVDEELHVVGCVGGAPAVVALKVEDGGAHLPAALDDDVFLGRDLRVVLEVAVVGQALVVVGVGGGGRERYNREHGGAELTKATTEPSDELVVRAGTHAFAAGVASRRVGQRLG